MVFVYILYSPSRDRYYTGITADLEDRLKRHNQGRSKSTKSGLPWILKFWESYESRSEAYQREQAIKRMKSRKYIEELISTFDEEHPA
ncbi:MAG: GIY-YIG nuclease family protein [Bacteroidota bacterium]